MNVLFLGTPEFAVPILQTLIDQGYRVVGVVTQPDRPKGRKGIRTPPPVKGLAQKYGLPVLQPESIRAADVLEHIRRLSPDLAVTAAYGQILPQDFLEIPRLGTINVHASLLPKYRGGAPIHRCLLNGDAETGVTIMKVVPKLDAGAILAQVKVPIREDDNVGTLHDKLAVAGARLLAETLPQWLNGEIREIPQNDEEATYAPNIRREDEIIDWNRSARDVHNHIRGLSPWPGAYTTWNGRILKLWESRYREDGPVARPGEVLQADEEGIVVAAGKGVVILLRLQPEGKTPMTAGEMVRGKQIAPGMVFGSREESA
jgi:methionyl-tRNA formyltransferase